MPLRPGEAEVALAVMPGMQSLNTGQLFQSLCRTRLPGCLPAG